jgi:adenylosuccinate synthase
MPQKIFRPDEGYADILLGLQFGDEAKARFVDGLAPAYNIIARFNGGPNAGHNIMVNGVEICLRQVPSAVCYPDKQLYIGPGCAVNLTMLEEEIQRLETAGLTVRHRLQISPLAVLIQPHHRVRDLVTMQYIGTTGNGMGAAYADESARMEYERNVGIRVGDLLRNTDEWLALIKSNLDEELQKLNMTPEKVSELSMALNERDLDVRKELENLGKSFEKLRKNVGSDPYYLQEQIRNGMKVLLEGAQSIGLCKTNGTRPFQTSSGITPGAAAHGAGIDTDFIRNKYGVIKATPSRVGRGPFVGEYGGERSENYWLEGNGYAHSREEEFGQNGHRLDEMLGSEDEFEVGMALRMLGGEYGASKRPRRMGKLDLTFLRTHIHGLGFHRLFISKIDQLIHGHKMRDRRISFIDEYILEGERLRKAPPIPDLLREVQVREKPYDAFDQDVSGMRSAEQLPSVIHTIINDIQDDLGVTVEGIGVGKDREQYIQLAI